MDTSGVARYQEFVRDNRTVRNEPHGPTSNNPVIAKACMAEVNAGESRPAFQEQARDQMQANF